MSNIDKEWLKQKIADMEATRDDIPFGLDEDDSNTLAALRIALASLEAEPVYQVYGNNDDTWSDVDEEEMIRLRRDWEDIRTLYTAPPAPAKSEPVAWLWSHRKHPSEVSLVRPEDDERAEGAHWSGWNCQALYAAPPASVSVPDDIDTRMKNAGMLSAAEIIAGQPIDAFMKHAGVVDLESLLKWSEMRRAEFLRMQAKYELGDNQKDDMYEWVISHVAAFRELHVNIRSAMLQGVDGSSPVLPDGWVACSERMPEIGVDVLACTISPIGGFEEIETAQWHGGMKGEQPVFITSADAIEPTHWMTLPAAPQQEVKP